MFPGPQPTTPASLFPACEAFPFTDIQWFLVLSTHQFSLHLLSPEDCFLLVEKTEKFIVSVLEF